MARHALEIVLSQDISEFNDMYFQLGCGWWSYLVKTTTRAISVPAETSRPAIFQMNQSFMRSVSVEEGVFYDGDSDFEADREAFSDSGE
jgi:hypothetical protein